MATTSPSSAPWRSTLLSHIDQMGSPIFVLSTLHPAKASSPSAADAPAYLPRARTVVFRGMWASLPENPKNQAERNPDIFESDLLTITTDARMDKVPELFGTASGTESSQSGPGGPVEAVIWAVEAHTQWRIRGRSYIIGPDIETDAAAPTRAALQTYMRSSGGDAASWSFARELTAHFGNLSPMMRGSFRNPPPGTPLSCKPAEGLGLGQKVEDLHDSIARENFRVVVIVPEEVDRVDLSDPAEAKRWNYEMVGSREVASWKVTELWP
ncbi:pyridoxamine 5'-phosphate oxidase-domain-containing protein [Stachybotrys elegans]|uniref:Pyridoxamine 5'-phosphate oxidase-domain-containing protein n=1 Tax=Stachybotrys elegans TaxID=80388 RepID=A0A8K0WVT7_9HYPO|nr:pyridoxamine 5'-phosphate oxidase-domain-containing protein [Stachybotrys elegans]